MLKQPVNKNYRFPKHAVSPNGVLLRLKPKSSRSLNM